MKKSVLRKYATLIAKQAEQLGLEFTRRSSSPPSSISPNS